MRDANRQVETSRAVEAKLTAEHKRELTEAGARAHSLEKTSNDLQRRNAALQVDAHNAQETLHSTQEALPELQLQVCMRPTDA